MASESHGYVNDLRHRVVNLFLLRVLGLGDTDHVLRRGMDLLNEDIGLCRRDAVGHHRLRRLLFHGRSGGVGDVDDLDLLAVGYLEQVEHDLPERVGLRRARALDAHGKFEAGLGAEDHYIEEERFANLSDVRDDGHNAGGRIGHGEAPRSEC